MGVSLARRLALENAGRRGEHGPFTSGIKSPETPSPASRRRGKRPPVEWVNAVELGSGRARDIRLYCPCVIADRRTVPCDLCFRFSGPVLIAALGPQKKPASAAGSEAGMDWGRRGGSILMAKRCGDAGRRGARVGGRKAARKVTPQQGSVEYYRGRRPLRHREPRSGVAIQEIVGRQTSHWIASLTLAMTVLL